MNIEEILKATEGHTTGEWEVTAWSEGDRDNVPCAEDETWLPWITVWYDSRGEYGWITVKDWELLCAAPKLRVEVIRIRERDAAWEWLADNGYKVSKVDGKYVALGVVEHQRTTPIGVQVVLKSKATADDTVALAKALGWKGME